MEYSLKALANWINKMDSYYEMSDDHRRLINGTNVEERVSHWLKGLTDEETTEVISHLDEDGLFNYNRYFKNK